MSKDSYGVEAAMDENFRDEYQNVKNEALLKTNSYFFDNMKDIAEVFRAALFASCECLEAMQQNGYQEIEYMEVTLLRTRMLERNYQAPVMVYGESWYADIRQAQVGEIPIESVFSFYDEMVRITEGLVKKYKTKLPEKILEICMCESAADFWNYVTMGCKQAVMGFSEDKIKITKDFRIRCCEYMGFGSVCRRHTPNMAPEQMKKWIDEKEKEVYRFRDYRGKDFSGWDFSGLDLTGCDFRDCNLEESNFEGANLTGAWFCNSRMRNCDLRGTWLPGARFDNADLREALLEGAYSASKINRSTWLRPDNVRASFCGANLTKADFTVSAIEFADFTSASMEKTLFDEEHKDYYHFDDKQLEQAAFDEDWDEE